ncbi:MAG: hypothetical protein LBQ23_01810 [Puniceicoccales bacterium]|nr:hypothetical protein [Puniceicoccales bacterium]
MPAFDKLPTIIVNLILISHYHLGHVGSLPYIMKRQQQARILPTQASHILLPRILNNCVIVMKLQRDELGRKEYPLYTSADIESLERHILLMQFGKSRVLRKDNDEITTTFFEAGHVVGAGSILVEYNQDSSGCQMAGPKT